MNVKKILALCLVLLMVTAMFAGCKSKDKDTGGGGTNNPVNTSSSGTTGQVAGETLGTIDDDATVYPSDDATVVVTTNGNFTGLTQFGNAFAATLRGSYLFYDSLLSYDINTNSPKACLAEKWEWVDDCTLRITLKEGITSVNGDPFTASDVVYTFNYNNSVPTLASYYKIFDYDKIKAIDELTVDIATLQPYATLPIDLCHAAYSMACEKSVEAAGGVEALKENPIAGTGAYKLIRWDEGVGIYAERRDDYWGQMPYYKYVNYLNVTDNNARYMGVEAGDFNMSSNNSAASMAAAETNPDVKAWRFAHSGQVTYLYLNTDANEYFRVKECRQAIALSIDYEAILQISSAGYGEVPRGLLFNQLTEWGPYKDGLPEDNYYLGKYDIELAKQKLVEAGYADGFKLELKINAAQAVQADCAAILSNGFAKIGLDCEIVQVELATLTSDTRAGNTQMRIVTGGNPNPVNGTNTIDPRLDHNTSNGNSGQYWFEGHTVDEVAEMIDAVKFTPVGDELNAAILKLENFIGEYVPKIPLVIQYIGVATTSDIAGFGFDSMGTPHPATFYPAEYLEGPAA